MSDYVWASDALIGSYHDFAGDVYFQGADAVEKAKRSVARSSYGYPLSREDIPSKTFADKTKPQKLKHFNVIGFFLVSPDVADVLRQVDLGQGGLYETEFFEKDQVTPLDYRHVYWDIGNQKDSFIADASPKADKTTAPRDWPEPDRARTRRRHSDWKDDDLALSADALIGPDCWVEKCFRCSFFMSDRLAQMLFAEGLDRDFNLKRCRILG
ncbi:hypothetical protein [Roseovarius sp.]|uniref:hypothetical protein n=1 Tax=Roseovarius sp. TaxID=1486281 RepID=UPI003B5C38F9